MLEYKIDSKVEKHASKSGLKDVLLSLFVLIVGYGFAYITMMHGNEIALQILVFIFTSIPIGAFLYGVLIQWPKVINNMVKVITIDKERDLVIFTTCSYSLFNKYIPEKVIKTSLSTLKLRKDKPPYRYHYFDDYPECYFINDTEMFCRIDYFTKELYEVFNIN